VRRQLWIDRAGPKAARFKEALDALGEQNDGGWTIRGRGGVEVGVVTWAPG
jgi:hypothetical protein